MRITLITLVALIAAACAALAVFVGTFGANAYKPRIEAIATRAIGRKLTLAGPIRLRLALHPTIELTDVALANPPGFSRPQMANVRAIDMQVALLPLLRQRIEIDRLTLVHPDILLERAADGTVNWSLGAPKPTALPAPVPEKAPQAQVGAQPTSRATQPNLIAVGRVEIQNGALGWRDDRGGQTITLAIRRLEASGGAGTAPMNLSAGASIQGVPITVAAQSGPLSQFARNGAWPVKATVRSGGITLVADGGRDASGWRFALDAAIPDLAALRPLIPQVSPLPLRDVTMTGRLSLSADGTPSLSAVGVHAGVSDLATIYPGLALARLEATAPAMDQPIHAVADLSLNGVPIAVSAQLGSPDALRDGTQARGAYPIDLTAQAAGASFTLRGGIASPRQLARLNANMQGKSADLAALSPLAGRALPAFRDVSLTAHVADSDGLTHGISLSDIRLAAPQGDIAGTIATTFGSPLNLHAALTSNRLDLDALKTVLAPPASALSTAPKQAGAAAPAKTTHPQVAAKSSRLIPDTPLPFARLRAVDGDVNLTVADLKLDGENWRKVALHLIVQGGRLALPFSAQLPGGPLTVSASADATQPVPTAALSLRAPALALQWLLTAAGQPGFARGSVAVTSDLHAAGGTTQALVASLDGTLTLSMAGGEIETRVLQQALGPVVARANLLGVLAKGGASEIRCLVMRAVSSRGHVRVSPLLLSSALLTLSGGGNLDLAGETFDMQLSPQGRVGGTTVAIPMRVTGSWLAPHVSVDDTRAAVSGLSAVVGALAGKPIPGVNEPEALSCSNALAGRQGAQQPGPGPTAAPAKPVAPPNPAELLRKLLR